MHEVLVNRLGGLSLPRKCVDRLTDRPDMTLDVYSGRKTTTQQQHQLTSGNIACRLHRINVDATSSQTEHLHFFLTNGIEFVLFLAVLGRSVLHMG